jgi:hypothetical protein
MSNTVTQMHRVLALCGILATALLFLGFSGGITNRTQKNGPGCTCHDVSPTAGVSVVISGPDTLVVGQTASYRVTVKGGPLASAGTNIAAAKGALSVIAGQGLQKIGDELTHTGPKAPSGDSVSFQFSYTAPGAVGADTIFANGNSVNLSGDNSGDQWNFAPRKRIVTRALAAVTDLALPLSAELYQNYPNPFNPSTLIRYQLPEAGSVSIKLFDLTGREIATLVNDSKPAGSHEVRVDAGKLASGVYLYRLEAGAFVETRKMTLLR